MLIRLSYPLETGSPLYPGTPPPSFEPFHTLGEGYASSSSTISFNTHFRNPHRCPSPLLPRWRICCGRPRVREGLLAGGDRPDPEEPGISASHPKTSSSSSPYLRGPGLFSSGQVKGKGGSGIPHGYEAAHAWIHPEIPDLLREHLPSLQLFGTDTISISSPAHREEGRACHRSFLCGSPPILVLEDLDLSDPCLRGRGFQLYIYPWFCGALDGVPVVAIMERVGKEP